MYLSMPKFRKGVPVTLAYFEMDSAQKENELLKPFPSWELNDDRSCINLQSVQSMEIDTAGVMWVLDGVRIKNNVHCPPKLMFFDLKYNGLLIFTYTFPNEISLQKGGFLNDIVIDESGGGYAYITDNSNIDPGLIVYSRKKNRVWKIRDRSMFPELWAANFIVDKVRVEALAPIDGIALSPKPLDPFANRTVFYTSLTGFDIFALGTEILKNEDLCLSDRWRTHVKFVGEKQGQTDGMMIDSKGNLYYTLLPLYGVGRWNIKEKFGSARIIDINAQEMVWPDGFAMDQKGYLYLISNSAFKYVNPETELKLTPDIKFRVFKLATSTRSYLYNDGHV
ncbi:hypothetical protein NQ317_011688 [Molorchus minor]|uniref:Uncharacterized protein n=1 Tax=Molorchus minor TaxID=1323400 RepID=A0ABQ9J8C3_9CUCU|nr:hypothetical protein NQ317_011688 [Molorchus minor]